MRRKFNAISAFILVLAGGWFMPLPAQALSPATYYIATTGSDTTGDGSEANPFASLQKAFSNMQGGDTLIIEDGNYTSSANSITQFNYPPSGTPGAFTVIKARNIPGQDGVPVNQPLKVKFSGNAKFSIQNYPNNDSTKKIEYIKFWGIRWNGIQTYINCDHLYFKQVASQGVKDGNAFTIGISGQYNLLEDVVAFGKGRYKICFGATYYTTNNLGRRCVIRQDWANKDESVGGGGGPIGGIVSYGARGTVCLNSIIIDSDTPDYWQESPTELAGAFYQPNDTGPHNFTIKGSIVINTAMAVLNNRSGSSGHIVQDLVAVKVAGGLGLQGATDVDRVTLADVGTDNFSYRSSTQINKLLVSDDGLSTFTPSISKTFNNSITRDTLDDGIDGGGVTNDYINMFQIGGTPYVTSPQALNFSTTDPFSNGLKYPVRIEEGSPLATQGSVGGQLGARIVNRLGKDGTFKGDPDWDTEQGPLWPWPLEDWVKAEMRTSEYTTDAKRGFCADGIGLYGGPITLTSYIWEYLGNPLPPEIYGTLTGDLNLDGRVSIADIQLCIKVILNQLDPIKDADIIQKAKELAAPYDAATIKDIQEIIKIILGG